MTSGKSLSESCRADRRLWGVPAGKGLRVGYGDQARGSGHRYVARPADAHGFGDAYKRTDSAYVSVAFFQLPASRIRVRIP